jgi:hypothetical protein
MRETIKSLLCSKERKLTEWEIKFLKDIERRLENKRLLSSKQKAVINKIFLKNNLPVEKTENKDAIIDKLEQVVITLNNNKDERFVFYQGLLDFYYRRGYLSQKQKNAVIKFDLNYTGKRFTAKPKGRFSKSYY